MGSAGLGRASCRHTCSQSGSTRSVSKRINKRLSLPSISLIISSVASNLSPNPPSPSQSSTCGSGNHEESTCVKGWNLRRGWPRLDFPKTWLPVRSHNTKGEWLADHQTAIQPKSPNLHGSSLNNVTCFISYYQNIKKPFLF